MILQRSESRPVTGGGGRPMLALGGGGPERPLALAAGTAEGARQADSVSQVSQYSSMAVRAARTTQMSSGGFGSELGSGDLEFEKPYVPVAYEPDPTEGMGSFQRLEYLW